MDRKKTGLYIILLVLLLGGVLLLPFGINFVTDAAVGAILNSTETETEIETELTEEKEETETESETICFDCEPETETEPESEAITEAEGSPDTVSREGTLQSDISSSGSPRHGESEAKPEELVQQQIDFAADMEAFASSFSPKITVLEGAEECYSDFIAGGEDRFLHAVAEYIYSHYGDLVAVDEIELIETVRSNSEECSLQACIYSGNESEIFILSYDRELNNYGIYPSYYVD